MLKMYYKILTLLKIIIVTSAFVPKNKSQIPLTLQKGIFENAFKNKSFENEPDSSGISQKKNGSCKNWLYNGSSFTESTH